jgi:methylthioribose-1-phosphate isomerase
MLYGYIFGKTALIYMDFVQRLKSLEIQSATTITIGSMEHLLGFSKKNGFGKEFDAECGRLLTARPTAVPLYNAIEMVKKHRTDSEIKKIISELTMAKEKTAGHASKIFLPKTSVLTHCHSTMVIAALLQNKKKIREVIVTETRPRDQGVKTAKELLAAKIPVKFIVDAAISDFISQTDIVVVGADALRHEGVVNKVGTHPIAVVAKENGKPFYVITSSFTEDRRKKFVMEQRPAAELHHPDLKGAKIFNPSFDITPWKYVTAVITEKGIITPARIKNID